jgi:hypothetical protein
MIKEGNRVTIVPKDIQEKYDCHEWRNASAVLSTAHPKEWNDIVDLLRSFKLYKSEVVQPGGRKSPIAERIDGFLYDRGWSEKSFDTKIVVDNVSYETPTHKVDCYKNRVALELEWNNKDPFFDRDLNNFRLLFDLRAIDAGVIITRGDDLDDIFRVLVQGEEISSSKFGKSTTIMEKLLPRIEGGGGGGCPILVFGITKKLYTTESPM